MKARSRGIDIAIVEAAPRLLTRSMQSEVAEELAELHRSRGVSLHLGTTVVEVLGEGRVERLIPSDGRAAPADTVLVGIGVRPSTDCLAGSGGRVLVGVLRQVRQSAQAGEPVDQE